MVLAYVTNRAIQQRLDDVLGPANWRNEYSKAPDDGVLCGISIHIGDNPISLGPNWITKFDGAENTQVEAVKGGLSGAMKRAAVQWGIGRYLYQLESTFVEVKPDKPGQYINIKDKDGKSLLTGYWNDPQLPGWALPPTRAKEPAAPAKPELISQAQFAELMQIAKLKGYKDKLTALEFIKEAAGISVAEMPAADFEMYKKRVNGNFKKPSDEVPFP